MTGKKSSREKRRKRSGQEAVAALATPDLVATLAGSGSGSGNAGFPGGSAGGGGLERGERRKRRSTDSSCGVSGSVPQVRARFSRPAFRKDAGAGRGAPAPVRAGRRECTARRGVSPLHPARPCSQPQVPAFACNDSVCFRPPSLLWSPVSLKSMRARLSRPCRLALPRSASSPLTMNSALQDEETESAQSQFTNVYSCVQDRTT